MPKSPYLRKSQKEYVVKVRNYFETEKNSGEVKNINAPVKRTAECLQISESTVKRITSEARTSDGQVTSPIKENKGRPKLRLEEYLKGVIRRRMHTFYIEKEFPTVQKLLKYLTENVPDFPPISESSFLKQLKEMGFAFKKFSSKPVLMESIAIRGARAEYLLTIARLRQENYTIYYTDETWCGANHSVQYGWQEQVLPNEKYHNFDYFRNVQQANGWRGGICKPSGAGKRVIILHIGNENGFLPDGKKCFVGKKNKSSDYHDEMNAKHYEEWFRHVLDVLPGKSAIVIDQAPYHTMANPETLNPTSKWLKDDIIVWLLKKNVTLPPGVAQWADLTKPMLLLQAKPHHNIKEKLLQKIVRESGKDVKLLWLPVAHCELNAIELVWAYIKNGIAKANKTFKVEDVCRIASDIMENIPNNLWRNCVRHVQKIEDKYRETEHIVDVAVEPMVINFDSDSSSDEQSLIDEDLDSEED